MRASADITSQMIGVVQTQPTPLLFKLIWRKALERSLRRDRHEDGKGNGAMGQVECCCAGFGDLIPSDLVSNMSPSHIPSTCREAQM